MFTAKCSVLANGLPVGEPVIFHFDSPRELMKFSRAGQHSLGKLLDHIDKSIDAGGGEWGGMVGDQTARFSCAVTADAAGGAMFNEWSVSWGLMSPEACEWVQAEIADILAKFEDKKAPFGRKMK